MTGFNTAGCTTTPDNFPVHTTANDLHWQIEAAHEGTATISGINIHNRVRHPLNTELEIGTSTLTGSMKVVINLEDDTVTFTNNAGEILINHQLQVTATGHLTGTNPENGSPTNIGIG